MNGFLILSNTTRPAVDPDDPWEVFVPDDDDLDPLPERGDFWEDEPIPDDWIERSAVPIGKEDALCCR